MLRLSLPVLFVVLALFASIVYGSVSNSDVGVSTESAASYRYRTSQASHWRAAVLRH